MPWLDKRSHDLHCKVVYLGPGLAGKTANLKALWRILPPEGRCPLIHLATETEQTAHFECLPVLLGKLAGVRARVHVYTVPGQILYEPSRREILHGADAIVFVADSRAHRWEANFEAAVDLDEPAGADSGPFGPPAVMQYNRRDAVDALPIDVLQERLNRWKVPYVQSVAPDDTGVMHTFQLATTCALTNAKRWSAA